jgi:hypothetical protein
MTRSCALSFVVAFAMTYSRRQLLANAAIASSRERPGKMGWHNPKASRFKSTFREIPRWCRCAIRVHGAECGNGALQFRCDA